jgi:hypothetical protein
MKRCDEHRMVLCVVDSDSEDDDISIVNNFTFIHFALNVRCLQL